MPLWLIMQLLLRICGFILIYIGTLVSAHSAVLNINVDSQSTGGIAGPLNVVGDTYCPSATTPGCDISASDNRVRTHDYIRYRASLQVGPAGDDVTLTMTLKPGLVIDQIPGGCDPFTSSINGDGSPSNPTFLECNIGNQASASLDVFIDARVLGTLANLTPVGVASAVVSGPSSTPVTAAAVADERVTAAPRYDLYKQRHSSGPQTRGGVQGMEISYRIWLGLWENTSVNPLLGNEMVQGNITFTDDLSGISPNAYVYQCVTSASNVFPYETYNVSFPERSVQDAGTFSCSATGAAATGSVTVTITGADLALEHIPTQTKFGANLPANVRAASFGLIRIFVPYSDITAAGGNLPTTNTLTGFDPTSISGQSNFLSGTELTSNNTVNYTLSAGTGAFSNTKRCYLSGSTVPAWCTGEPWSSPATNASGLRAGDGLVEPEQTFVTYTYYRNRAVIPDDMVEVCTLFDDRYYKPQKYNATDASRCFGTCGTRNVDYVIEYGTGNASTAWRDMSTTPASTMEDECTVAASNWHTSFDAAQSMGNITKVRMRRLTQGNPGAAFAIGTHHEAYPASAIPSVPNGTLLKSWGSYKSTVGSTNFKPCAYQPGTASTNHTHVGCGTRLTLSRATARIDKTTQPNDLANFLPAGGEVTFKLAPSFTSLGGSITDNVIIVDEIPAGAEYVTGSAIQGGTTITPIITPLAGGEQLSFDLGVIPVNVPIVPIEFKMRTSASTSAGTVFTNVARIDTVSDISSAALRSDTRAVTVSSPAGMVVDKTVLSSNVPTDQPIEFQIEYFNGTSSNFNKVDVIDILPHNGDVRIPGSDFSGTIGLSSLSSESSNVQYYVTKQPFNALEGDPQHASNDLTTGTIPWCPMTSAGTVNSLASPTIGGSSSLCPQTNTDLTAFRIVDTAVLSPGNSVQTDVEFMLSGNAAGDVYSNSVVGSSDGVVLSAESPTASTEIIGFGEIEAMKKVAVWDPNNLGLYSVPGNEVIYTITIKNIGTGNIDSGSIFFVDSLPPEIDFWNGDIDAGGPNNYPALAAVGFDQIVGTGIIFNTGTDLRYSTANAKPTSFAECSGIALDGTFRPDIKHICFKPQGALENGSPNPEIAFSFRARIK